MIGSYINVTPTSEVHMVDMALLLVRNQKYEGGITSSGMSSTKFHKNPSTRSKLREGHTQTH